MIKKSIGKSNSISNTHNKRNTYWYPHDKRIHTIPEDGIYISVDNFIEFVYSLQDNVFILQDISGDTDQSFLLSIKDYDLLRKLRNFIHDIKTREEKVKDDNDNTYEVYSSYNYDLITIVNSDHNFILQEYPKQDKVHGILIGCKDNSIIDNIAEALQELYDTIEVEYNKKIVEEISLKTNLNIKGISVEEYMKDIDKDIYSVDTWVDSCRCLLIPCNTLEDYKDMNKILKKGIEDESMINTGFPFTYLFDMEKNKSTSYCRGCFSKIKNYKNLYLFSLCICKKYGIDIVFDFKCDNGFQSWFFNNNKVNYIGINEDSNKCNIFPYRSNMDKKTIYYQVDKWNKIYKGNDNFGIIGDSYKNSLAICINDIDFKTKNPNDPNREDRLNDTYIRTLMNHHKYALISLSNCDPIILDNSKVLKDYCEKLICYNSKVKDLNNPKLITNSYILLSSKVV